jgi:hypothetical protein
LLANSVRKRSDMSDSGKDGMNGVRSPWLASGGLGRDATDAELPAIAELTPAREGGDMCQIARPWAGGNQHRD